MDSIKSHLELLTEDSQGNVNYISWRFKVDLTLKSKDVYDVAIGLKVKPPGVPTDELVKAWIKKDLEAQAIVGLNVNSNIAKKIANSKTAKDMLDKLNNLYGKKSDITVEGLQRKFFCYVYDINKSAVENCMDILQITEDLTAEGDRIKDSWIMTRILSMLPPKLHHFRTAWDNVSTAEKAIDTLIERLRLEEDRLSESDRSSGTTTQNALVTKSTKKPRQYNSPRQESTIVTCFKCGQKGHIKKYCRNKSCAKYIEYCKLNYSCNICGQKGHFAKDCTKRKDERNINEGPNRHDSWQSNTRAFVTVGLSTAKLSTINSNQNSHNFWYQDCAATQHMTSHRNWFTNYIELEQPSVVLIGDSTELEGIGIGNVELEAYNGENWYNVVLENVLYVPKINFNLFSVGQILDKGYVQTADREKSIFRTSDYREIVAMAERDGNLFKMKLRRNKSDKCLFTASIRTWHERLAHQNIKYVRDILNRNKIKYTDDWNNYICEGCIFGKQHRISHPTNDKVAKQPLDLVHVDLKQ